MTEPEKNFSICLNNEECRLGVGNNWLTLDRGTSYGNRELYSGSDERGITYRIFWLKRERSFEELYVDEPTYQGAGSKKFTIPKNRQSIHI